jgi:hypothetical protein
LLNGWKTDLDVKKKGLQFSKPFSYFGFGGEASVDILMVQRTPLERRSMPPKGIF